MSRDKRACIACRWEESGKCRKNPPQLIYIPTERYPNGELRMNGISCADWPEVSAADWCWEYRMKKNLLAEIVKEMGLSMTDRRIDSIERGEV